MVSATVQKILVDLFFGVTNIIYLLNFFEFICSRVTLLAARNGGTLFEKIKRGIVIHYSSGWLGGETGRLYTVFTPEGSPDTIPQAHNNTSRAYAKPEKGKRCFFIPRQVCGNNGTADAIAFIFLNAPYIDAFFHGVRLYGLPKEMIQAEPDQGN